MDRQGELSSAAMAASAGCIHLKLWPLCMQIHDEYSMRIDRPYSPVVAFEVRILAGMVEESLPTTSPLCALRREGQRL
jgi:hypothetical protein